jgi:hypothetical protein
VRPMRPSRSPSTTAPATRLQKRDATRGLKRTEGVRYPRGGVYASSRLIRTKPCTSERPSRRGCGAFVCLGTGRSTKSRYGSANGDPAKVNSTKPRTFTWAKVSAQAAQAAGTHDRDANAEEPTAVGDRHPAGAQKQGGRAESRGLNDEARPMERASRQTRCFVCAISVRFARDSERSRAVNHGASPSW